MKNYKGFIPTLHIDTEEGIIRGKVINTRDTITFYGKTVEEAWSEFEKSVDDYLAFCAEIGVEPEKPYNGKILVRVKPSVHRLLSLRAQEKGQSVNRLIVGELYRSLRKQTPDQPEATAIPEPAEKPRIAASAAATQRKVKVGSK
jgi:predicted HicB family RNase H-like nuclease